MYFIKHHLKTHSLRLIIDSAPIIAEGSPKVNRIAADFYRIVKAAAIRLPPLPSYFFVYCVAKTVCRKTFNGLDFPLDQSYNPNAPGGRQICRIPRERFHTTTCLTITASGGRGNSGEKSAGEQVFRSGKGQMVFMHM
jgi:hypothetical protein